MKRTNSSRPRINSVNSRTGLSANRSQIPQDISQLLQENEDLRKNQSALLDRIIEKDKIIEQLQTMIENGFKNEEGEENEDKF